MFCFECFVTFVRLFSFLYPSVFFVDTVDWSSSFKKIGKTIDNNSYLIIIS
jgi:hypothetical protein